MRYAPGVPQTTQSGEAAHTRVAYDGAPGADRVRRPRPRRHGCASTPSPPRSGSPAPRCARRCGCWRPRVSSSSCTTAARGWSSWSAGGHRRGLPAARADRGLRGGPRGRAGRRGVRRRAPRAAGALRAGARTSSDSAASARVGAVQRRLPRRRARRRPAAPGCPCWWPWCRAPRSSAGSCSRYDDDDRQRSVMAHRDIITAIANGDDGSRHLGDEQPHPRRPLLGAARHR